MHRKDEHTLPFVSTTDEGIRDVPSNISTGKQPLISKKKLFVSAHPNKLGGGHVCSQEGSLGERTEEKARGGGVCASQPSFLFACAFAIRLSPKVHPKLLL